MLNQACAKYSRGSNPVQNENADAIASTNLRSAYSIANGGTVESLSQAIKTASSIPSSSSAKAEATEAVNNWSDQLFAIAQARRKAIAQSQVDIIRTYADTLCIVRSKLAIAL
ncbi:MAG: hypothetical protein WBB28_20635 [Crinalium sp.]